MLRKSLKTVFIALLVISFATAAPALTPQEALSARASNSFYAVMSFDNLNGMLNGIFSPANIEMMASLAEPEDAQVVRLMASFVSQIPAQSVSAVIGAAPGGDAPGGVAPFLQVAAAMPDAVRHKLDRVADGTASGVEIVTLLLGDGGVMLAGGFIPEVHKDPAATYYTFGELAFAAKDNLLLISSSVPELTASFNALAKQESRLALKRRFSSPDYWYMHMDMPAMMSFSKVLGGDDDLPDPEVLAGMFKAPLDVEIDFTSKPGSFLMSCAVNAIEALADATRYQDMKPADKAGMFMAGGGKLLAAIASPLNLRAEDLKASPEAEEVWSEIVEGLAHVNISESELLDLFSGNVSLAFGSEATVMGKRAPGGYIALTGKAGAAANIMGKIMGNEEVSQAMPVAPVSAEGWNSLFAVDPSMLPVPLMFGVKGDTLFVGVVDTPALGKAPEFAPETAKMYETPLFAGGFFDFDAIWNLARQEVADPTSLLSMFLPDESLRPILSDLLSAELSVPLVKLWASELETSFMEFSIVDVPVEKRLLPKVIQIAQMFAPQE